MSLPSSLLSTLFGAVNEMFPFSVSTADGAIELLFSKQVKTKVKDEDLKTRLQKLEAIQTSMREAAEDIGQLRAEVAEKLKEMQDLKVTIEKMEKDKDGVETMLSIKKETFEGLMSDVQRKSEKRTILIGIIIGFLTGAGSSYFVWILTSN